MRIEFRTADGRTTYAPPSEAFRDDDGTQYVFLRTDEGNIRKATATN